MTTPSCCGHHSLGAPHWSQPLSQPAGQPDTSQVVGKQSGVAQKSAWGSQLADFALRGCGVAPADIYFTDIPFSFSFKRCRFA